MLLRARTLAGSSGPRALGLLILLTALGLIVAAQARSAATRPSRTAPAAAVPEGFVGVDADGPVLDPSTSIDFAQQVETMVSTGVQSIRVAFSWSAAEPYQRWSDVPAALRAQFTNVGGQPVDFQTTDIVVGDAAGRGVSVLPTVLYAPSWDATNNPNGVDTPRQDAPYAAYLTALIDRYGPHGTFWPQHPTLPRSPIRSWQIWNEPNLAYYWRQPFAAGYVGLLRAAHTAVKRADPGAKVVLGALTNLAWKSLGQIYRVPGARGLFDVVAVNGFTKLPANVILYLRLVRNAMDRFHDRATPLLATEVSWPSAVGMTKAQFDFDTTQGGQARNIARLLPQLGADRRSLGLAGFYYYTWMGAESRGAPAFDFAGLLGYRNGGVVTKPALAAFQRAALALEGCKRKGSAATSCIR